MIIYKMTHKPSSKFYIGSLKDNNRWEKYYSSSKIVAPMIKASPEEWTKEVLCFIDEDNEWDFQRVVRLEEQLIKRVVEQLGWEAIWNRHYGGQHAKYNPECEPKRRESIRNSFTSKRREQLSKRAKQQVGTSHPQYKGTVIGTCIETGNKVYFNGKKELQCAGFHQGSVWHCIHKKRNHHKGYIWELSNDMIEKFSVPYPLQDADIQGEI